MSTAKGRPRPAGRLARFELMHELGRGAQARVWLAHDPRLDREVALKLLDPGADAIAVSQWLHEARAVSRLTHPNIVPVFEADEHEGQPYLVFEYVPGPTLSQARRGKPGWPPRAAVTLLLGVLDALAAAHELGIVHRDLKPSNILLGSDGRARVMDFGIAARIAQDDDAERGRIVGTPGYMSPEAARGEAPAPAMDVFAAGVLLGELLSGGPLLDETDPYRAVERVQHEDLLLPARVQVDEVLRGIVQRALARRVDARYDSARTMHAALQAWMQPAAEPAPETGSSHATLEFLLRRMRHKTDFPALSASVVRIQRVATSETESLGSLTEEILKDVALTNKLLRMVNTAHFTAVSGGGIGTVSRAVALIGFAGIRNMALSVLLLEHMADKAHASLLQQEFLRALMAGTLADELSPQPREREDAFLGAMFQNLGRLLTEFYFPEEAMQIRQQLAGHEASAAERDGVARRVLGISLDELGAGVAKAWGLPENLQRAARMPAGEVPVRAVDRGVDRGVERLRWLGRAANSLADAVLSGDGEAQTAAVAAVADRHAAVLGMNARDVVAAAQGARTRVSQLAQALGLQVGAGSTARLAPAVGPAPRAAPAPGPAARTAPAAGPAAPAGAAEDKTLLLGEEAVHADTRAVLAQALEEVRGAIADKTLRLNEVLHLVLSTLHRALDFRCVVFCVREPGSGQLVGRVGLGPGASEICASFRITPDRTAVGDLFGWLCAQGSDLLVTDSAGVRSRLPSWYRQRVDAPTFLLLPVMLKGAPIGLIYADKERAGSIVIEERELAMVRALRDQAAVAFGKGQP